MTNEQIYIEQLLATMPPELRDELEEAVCSMISALIEVLPSAIEYLVAVLPPMICEANNLLDCCPNRRVLHLARHGRKRRTRKKNMRRAYKMIGAKEVGI